MANSIVLAQKYVNDPENFNQVLRAGSLTSLLLTERVKFLDGNTVKIPKYGFSTQTQGTYSRETGTTLIGLVETWDTYTLTRDMGETIQLDVMDDEETLGEGIIRRANERVRQAVVPSNDAYIFGKLATVPTPAANPTVLGAKIVTSAALTKANAIEAIDTAIAYMEENEVGSENLVLFVTAELKMAMQRSSDITRTFGVKERELGGVNTKFDTYNDAIIVTVPKARLGANVEFILVNPKCVTYVNKFHESRLINLTDTDDRKFGWAWKYRQYGDFFLSKGVAIVEGTGANQTLVNPGVYVKKIGA